MEVTLEVKGAVVSLVIEVAEIGLIDLDDVDGVGEVIEEGLGVEDVGPTRPSMATVGTGMLLSSKHYSLFLTALHPLMFIYINFR